jgi:flagella basal body P-ring formation protein FlgA
MRNTLLIVASICIAPTEAATLRNATTLHHAEVRVADLFDDAGPVGERMLGTGPAPGGRIVVEAAQAAAIARQFGVAWRPSAGGERVVIDRPGRAISREEILATLRAGLRQAGAAGDVEIELHAFAAPMIPPEMHAALSVEQLDISPSAGHFTADLAIEVAGEPRQTLHLAGQLQQMTDAVIAKHKLPAGMALSAADVVLRRMPISPRNSDAAHTLAQVVGQALAHAVNADQPIALVELGQPVLVKKGALVQMQLQAPGLTLAASGEATDAGGMGDRIGVLNPISGAIVEAQIIGPDQVRVAQGSALRRPARGTAMSQR